MKGYSRLYVVSCTPEPIGEIFQDLVHQILLINAGAGRLRLRVLLPFLQTEVGR